MGCCSSARSTVVGIALLHLIGSLGCIGFWSYLISLDGESLAKGTTESWALLTSLHLPIIVEAEESEINNSSNDDFNKYEIINATESPVFETALLNEENFTTTSPLILSTVNEENFTTPSPSILSTVKEKNITTTTPSILTTILGFFGSDTDDDNSTPSSNNSMVDESDELSTTTEFIPESENMMTTSTLSVEIPQNNIVSISEDTSETATSSSPSITTFSTDENSDTIMSDETSDLIQENTTETDDQKSTTPSTTSEVTSASSNDWTENTEPVTNYRVSRSADEEPENLPTPLPVMVNNTSESMIEESADDDNSTGVTVPPIITTTGYLSAIITETISNERSNPELDTMVKHLSLSAIVLSLLFFSSICGLAAFIMLVGAIMRERLLFVPWIIIQWLTILLAIAGVGVLTWQLLIANVLLLCWWLLVLCLSGVVVLILSLALVMEAYHTITLVIASDNPYSSYEMDYMTKKTRF